MPRYVVKIFLSIFTCCILAIGGYSVADAKRKQPFRIAALNNSWGPTPPIVGLRDGLMKLGYVENKDFVIGIRFTQGKLDVFPDAINDLIRFGVDLLFVENVEAARAAQHATTQIPIIFAGGGNPVETGLVKSFAQPAGNLTGVTDMELHLGPKRLQLFQEMIPTLKRVIFPYDAADAYAVEMAKSYREAAQSLNLEFTATALQSQQEAERVLKRLRPKDVDGVLVPWSPSLNIPGFILDISIQHQIPAMFSAVFYPEHGGLTSYSPSTYATGLQASRIVDKIMKGDKPANTPVEVNEKIEFVINLKTANSLGLTIPPEILYQADRLIR